MEFCPITPPRLDTYMEEDHHEGLYGSDVQLARKMLVPQHHMEEVALTPIC